MELQYNLQLNLKTSILMFPKMVINISIKINHNFNISVRKNIIALMDLFFKINKNKLIKIIPKILLNFIEKKVN